jgi:lipid II:glycine glycyltransferase (peptidoglycan interpeptide bridge formation enzyme)
LQFSASLFREVADSGARNAIGRANRFLFWTEMLRCKEQGLKCFDFGGWYPGNTEQELLQINQFKSGFGGHVLREYECEKTLSIRGWVVLTVAALLQRVRRGPRSAAP